MPSSRLVIAALLLFASGVGAACSTEGSDGVITDDSDLTIGNVSYLGKIGSGETLSSSYSSAPGYRSYGFDAKGGDQIDVRIDSHDGGDAIGYITDASYNVLASSKDAGAGATITYAVPAGQPSRPFRVAFRDERTLEAGLDVTLSVHGTGPAVCSYAGQSYGKGDKFQAVDGCNTCTCGPGGAVTCSSLVCGCNPATEWWRTYLGTPEQCMVIRYTCAVGRVPFSNNCGCGCENTTH
jgi:hypothetical protein